MSDTTHSRKDVTLAVSGMTCSSCRSHVEQALAALAGVENVQVELAAGRARVGFDPELTTEATLVGAVHAQGYGAEVVRDPAAEGPIPAAAGCCARRAS